MKILLDQANIARGERVVVSEHLSKYLDIKHAQENMRL